MRWRNFDHQFRLRSASTAKVSDTRLKNCRSKQNVVSAVRTILTKDAQIKNLKNQSVPIVRSHMLRHTKGVQNTKSRHSSYTWLTTKKHAATVSQNTLPQPKTNKTLTFTAEQLTNFVANVVTQRAQPQVCYPNPKQDTLDLKSSMCRKISNAAKTILSVDITRKDLF